MNASNDRHLRTDLSSALSYHGADEPALVPTPWKAVVYAKVERQIRCSKRLVVCGSISAFVGVIAYCVVTLSSGVNEWLGSGFFGSSISLVVPTLGVIGLGTLVWLIGSLLYLTRSMDVDPNDTDLKL